MRVCSLDLELNEPGVKDRIIQIGYVIGDIITKEILLERSLFLALPEGETLQPFIEKLTGILPAQLDGAYSFHEAYGVLLDDVKQFTESKKEGAPWMPLIQWGGGDDRLLKNAIQGEAHWRNTPPHWPFGRVSWDVKKHVQSYLLANGMRMQGGLKTSCRKLNVPFKGPAHDALNDARATFYIYAKVLEILKGGTNAGRT